MPKLIKNRRPKVGDRVRFSSPTRSGARTATRKVKALGPNGSVVVGFHGWPDFIVHRNEIHGIVKEATHA